MTWEILTITGTYFQIRLIRLASIQWILDAARSNLHEFLCERSPCHDKSLFFLHKIYVSAMKWTSKAVTIKVKPSASHVGSYITKRESIRSNSSKDLLLPTTIVAAAIIPTQHDKVFIHIDGVASHQHPWIWDSTEDCEWSPEQSTRLSILRTS